MNIDLHLPALLKSGIAYIVSLAQICRDAGENNNVKIELTGKFNHNSSIQLLHPSELVIK